MIRAVFDTVIFVRSLINPRSLCGRLVFQHFADYRLFVSAPVLFEILEVLRRPEITTRFRTLEGQDRGRALQILGQAELVEPATITVGIRDPKDDKFLATAVAASAGYLVTEDRDLLVIEQYQEVRIVDTATFLAILEQSDRP